MIFSLGSDWKYLDNGTDQGSNGVVKTLMILNGLKGHRSLVMETAVK